MTIIKLNFIIVKGAVGIIEYIFNAPPPSSFQSPYQNVHYDENMVSYLAKVAESGSSGGQFGRVLERQRNLFALKASVLSNFRQPGEDCLALLEQARTVAGDAWRANRQLRLTEPQVEKKQ